MHTKSGPHRVTVVAPATVSNLGPAYDALGIAIDGPADTVVAERTAKPGLVFEVGPALWNPGAGSSPRSGRRAAASRSDPLVQTTVPADPRRNVAAHVASLLLEELRAPFGVRLVLQKGMPVGSGLGSSAASSVAAALAVNALLPRPLDRRDLLRFAVEGERLACGVAHADNVAPCLLGGACLVRCRDPLDVISIPVTNSIVWVVVHPHVTVRTRDARRVVPRTVALDTAVAQWANVGALVLGLVAGDARLVGRSVQDAIVEPARAPLVPAFAEVKRAALAAGALGCSLSGAGPSMFAVCASRREAEAVGIAMAGRFRRVASLASDIFISRINLAGARIKSLRP